MKIGQTVYWQKLINLGGTDGVSSRTEPRRYDCQGRVVTFDDETVVLSPAPAQIVFRPRAGVHETKEEAIRAAIIEDL